MKITQGGMPISASGIQNGSVSIGVHFCRSAVEKL